jgi:hypothetical protein
LPQYTYSSAFVQTDVDRSLEEDKVALGKLKRLELGPQRVALVISFKVLKQVGIDGAAESGEGGKR